MIATCSWFAACINDADGVLPHPILGNVPCCIRCARTVGAEGELVIGVVTADA